MVAQGYRREEAVQPNPELPFWTGGFGFRRSIHSGWTANFETSFDGYGRDNCCRVPSGNRLPRQGFRKESLEHANAFRRATLLRRPAVPDEHASLQRQLPYLGPEGTTPELNSFETSRRREQSPPVTTVSALD